MRKTIVSAATPAERPAPEGPWLDLERLARVEVTSEEADHPIEGALLPGAGPGWRASAPGPQTVRLRFDTPRSVGRVRLRIRESALERTQELVLRASTDGERFHDVVRQQWNFSPSGSTEETEEFEVRLPEVAALELTIVPHVGGGEARASLEEMRLA